MSFYEDLEKSLQQAIQIEKGNIPMRLVEDMPAPTYRPKSNDNIQNTKQNMN